MKVLILYTELADYFIKCCEDLSAHAEVHIVRWPVNKEAPFKFRFPAQLKIYDKNDYSENELKKLAGKINPDLVVCSGWIDKRYLRITKDFYGRVPTVMTCDTWWKGNVKQWIAILLGRLFLMRIFSHAWVPGEVQARYVRRLGFKPGKILKGFYSCDLPHFNSLFEKRKSLYKEDFPKRLIFIGRYYEFKGLPELWEAFKSVKSEDEHGWELWCIGTGSLIPAEHDAIKHFGFIQPTDLEPYLLQGAVFVLPSRFEPWGVVVHEMAAAGFPLLLSDAVGAAEVFLQNGANGFIFKAGDQEHLKQTLKKIIHLKAEDLDRMSHESHRLAQQISPALWTKNLLSLRHGTKD